MTQEQAITKWNPFELTDKLEDTALAAELKGKTLELYVYAFRMGGKLVRGFSTKGTEAACRELAMKHGMAIRVLTWHVEPTDKGYYAVATAGRYAVSADGREVLLDTALGSKEQPFLAKRKNGTTYQDTNVYDKALTKATRNAKLKLIPEELKEAVIAEFVRLYPNKVAEIDTDTGEIIEGKGGAIPESPPEDTAHWCEEHKANWFKRGKMKGYAHPVLDAQGQPVLSEEGRAIWCNEPTEAPESSSPQKGAGASPSPAEASPSPAGAVPQAKGAVKHMNINGYQAWLEGTGKTTTDVVKVLGGAFPGTWLNTHKDEGYEGIVELCNKAWRES